MKKIVLVGFWLILVISTASAQSFQWAHSLGLPNKSRAMAIALDSSGNSYTFGTTKHSTNPILGAFPTGELLLEKRDSTGKVIWTKTFPGLGCGLDVAVNKSGDVLLTGGFHDSLFFGGDTLRSPWLVDGLFLASFSSDGDLHWAIGDTSIYGVLGISITIADENSFYVSGVEGSIYGLLRKYDLTGKKLWEKHVDAVRNFDNVILDHAGNIYVSGTCNPQAIFDTIVMPPDSAASGYITFVAKLDPSGKTIWLRANPYSTFDISTTLAFDGFGYLCRVRKSKDFTSNILEVIDPMIDSVLATWSFPAAFVDFDRLITNTLTSTGSSNPFSGPYYVNSFRDTTVIYELRHGISGQGIIFFVDTFRTIISRGLRGEALSLFDGAVYFSGYYNDTTIQLGSLVLTNPNDLAKFETDVFLTRIIPEGFLDVKPTKAMASDFLIYPNPVIDGLTISFDDASKRTIEIYTSVGIMVYRKEFSSTEVLIDLKNIPSGMYSVVVRGSKGLESQKFIRQ